MAEAAAPNRLRRLAALLPAAVVPLVGALVYFALFAGAAWARWVYVLVKLFTLVWPLFAIPVLLRRRLPRVRLGDRRHRVALLPGLAVGGALAVAVLLLQQTALAAVVEAHADQIRHKVAQLGVLDHYIAFGLFLSLLHSGLEEYYWRWFLFGSLRRSYSLAAATSLASLAFGAHHAVVLLEYFPVPWAVAGTGAVVLGGAIWCLMLERQRTLTGAWLSHALVDIAVLWVGYQVLF